MKTRLVLPYIATVLVVLITLTFRAALPARGATRSELTGRIGHSPSVDLRPLAVVNFSPTDIANTGVTGDTRLFVAEQNGRIRIVQQDGTVMATPYLDIADRVDGGSEMGLLGLTFDSDYASNGYFYVNYTHVISPGDMISRISRFDVTADPNVADPSSELIIFSIAQPHPNHNAGDLTFGPDGYLYFGLGDGGSAGDPDNRAQDPQDLLGKMLRIDVSAATTTTTYLIPPDNPFVGDPSTLDEIWALGLRNPWRLSFDRATGDLYMGDVGQDNWEEIDYQPQSSSGGENYGWRCFEGNVPFNTTGCGAPGKYDFPVFVYPHQPDAPGGCAVIGGYVYRGLSFSGLVGHYLLADNCFGWLWGLDINDLFAPSLLGRWPEEHFTTFGEDVDGELYVASSTGNTIYQVVEGNRNYLPLAVAGQ